RPTAFADSETETFLHCDSVDQLHRDRYVITGHNHLYAIRQCNFARYVCGTEIELRTVFVEEWRMTTTFCLRQHVNFGLEFSVRSYRTWFTDNHTTTDIGFLNTTQQQTHVVTSFTVIQNLTEHFHPCYGRLQVLGTHSKDLNRITRVNHTTLDTAGSYSTTTSDGEHV